MPVSPHDVRLCDFCNKSTALLFCKADSAKLCFACDRQVHSTNPLFTKHLRFQLCDLCSSSPATFFCVTDRSLLCHNCDFDTHNTFRVAGDQNGTPIKGNLNGCSLDFPAEYPGTVGNSGTGDQNRTPNRGFSTGCPLGFAAELRVSDGGVHDRRAIEGFTGCPSVSELWSFVGLEGLDSKGILGGDDEGDFGIRGGGGGGNSIGFWGGLGEEEEEGGGVEGFLVWDTPAIVSIDELMGLPKEEHEFHAMGVPSLNKDRNLACGQYKQEIICQLRDLAKSESVLNPDSRPVVEHQSFEHEHSFGVRDKFEVHKQEEEQIAFLHHKTSPYVRDNNREEAITEVPLSSALQQTHVEECALNPEKQSGFVRDASLGRNEQNEPNPNGPESSAPRVHTFEFNAAERDSALSRYKEKKRTRRYEKHIRYQSRKVQAEGRTRIKGRFAKIDHRQSS